MASPASPMRRLRATSRWTPASLAPLWRRADLLLVLAMREIKPRYRQTALGVVWVILQPLAAAAIFSVVFGTFGRLPSDGMPYLLFAFCGFLAWSFFAGVVTRGSLSMVANTNLITKVYMPRILMPLSSLALGLIDVVVGLVVLLGLLVLHGSPPGWQLVLLPLPLLLMALFTIGVTVWLCALSVNYRDITFVMPVLLQLGMFATPVAYSASLVPERWHVVLALNPMVTCVEGFRLAILGRTVLTWQMVLASCAITLVVLLAGLVYFRRIERTMSDSI